MPKFEIIENRQEIKLDPNKWVDVPASTGVLVDKMGNRVNPDFNGRKYELITKECAVSALERFGRGFLGVIAIICTLGCASFSNSVRELFHKKLTRHFGISKQDLILGPGTRALTRYVGLKVFDFLSCADLIQCSLVDTNWGGFTNCEAAWKGVIQREMAFGKRKWATLGIDIGEEPPLPKDIYQILKSPCPVFSHNFTARTHILVLIPSSFTTPAERDRTTPLTIDKFAELISEKDPNDVYRLFKAHMPPVSTTRSVTMPYWVLMTRDFIKKQKAQWAGEDDRIRISEPDQWKIVSNLASRLRIDYQPPSKLELVFCFYMKNIGMGNTVLSLPWVHLAAPKYNEIGQCTSFSGEWYKHPAGNKYDVISQSGVCALRRFSAAE